MTDQQALAIIAAILLVGRDLTYSDKAYVKAVNLANMLLAEFKEPS